MKIIAKCPRCSAGWLLDGSDADKRIRCRKCRYMFKVPKLEELGEAKRIVESAKGTVFVDKDGNTYA